MKQRIEPHERQRIKDLLLSGEEVNYKLAVQLLSIFFDKREARRFIWYECLASHLTSTLTMLIVKHKDIFREISYKEKWNEERKFLLDCAKKWIHSGNKDAAYFLYMRIYTEHDKKPVRLLLHYLKSY